MAYWDFTEPDKKIELRIDELTSLINNLECNKDIIIETGVYKGTSTRCFSKLFNKVYSIDIREDVFQNLEQFNLTNVIPILRGKNELNINDKTIDVIYIDGDHLYEGVLSDLKELTPKVKKGGYVCGHDYGSPNTGVKEAVNEFFKKVPDSLTNSHTSHGKNFIYKL